MAKSLPQHAFLVTGKYDDQRMCRRLTKYVLVLIRQLANLLVRPLHSTYHLDTWTEAVVVLTMAGIAFKLVIYLQFFLPLVQLTSTWKKKVKDSLDMQDPLQQSKYRVSATSSSIAVI